MIFQGKNIFSLMIIVITLVFGYCCIFDVHGHSKIFPLILIILLAGLSTLEFLEETFPSLRKHLRFVTIPGFFGDANQNDVNHPEDVNHPKEDRQRQIQALLVFIFILGLIIGLRFINFLFAIPLFVAVLLIVMGRVGWKSSLEVSIGTGIFIYVVFIVVLKFNG